MSCFCKTNRAYNARLCTDRPYDYYDLGEFPQKNTVRTKWGQKWELDRAIKSCHWHNIQVYADMVMNHMDGGDESEWVEVLEFDEWNRNKCVGGGWYGVWTKVGFWLRFSGCVVLSADRSSGNPTFFQQFNYWGRRGKYADFWINHDWFDWVGAVFDGAGHYRRGIFRMKNKPGNQNVSQEGGHSVDFLTGLDLDVCNPHVSDRLKWWGEWMVRDVKIDGFRLDAVKHIDWGFMKQWIEHVRHFTGRNLFAVGEYISGSLAELEKYLNDVNFQFSLFDVPLHFNLVAASRGPFDLRKILRGTLVEKHPDHAVTYVDNHDTQPLRSPLGPLGDGDFVKDWFRPHAYALILLRRTGYPCVF